MPTPPRPVYRQVVFLPATPTTKPQELHVYVSATDGAVLLKSNRLHTARKPSAGAENTKDMLWVSLGKGRSLYSGEVPLNTAASPSSAKGGPYQLNDLVHNAKTYDLRNKEDTTDGGDSEEGLFRDRDNQW